MSLPSDSVIHDIKCRLQLVGQSEQLVRASAHGRALEMYLIPVTDPDTTLTFDQAWDRFVPKDSDLGTLDFDTTTADATPMWEPGEHELADMFDVGFQPEQLWAQHRIITMAGGAIHIFQNNQTPFATVWQAGALETIRVRRRLSIGQPSVLVIGFGVPAFDDTTATLENALTEAEWAQIKYIDHTLERMQMDVLGLTEAGAETPWEESTALIFKHLEPDVYEATAGFFQTENYEVVAELVVDHSVKGDFDKMTISSGR